MNIRKITFRTVAPMTKWTHVQPKFVMYGMCQMDKWIITFWTLSQIWNAIVYNHTFTCMTHVQMVTGPVNLGNVWHLSERKHVEPKLVLFDKWRKDSSTTRIGSTGHVGKWTGKNQILHGMTRFYIDSCANKYSNEGQLSERTHMHTNVSLSASFSMDSCRRKGCTVLYHCLRKDHTPNIFLWVQVSEWKRVPLKRCRRRHFSIWTRKTLLSVSRARSISGTTVSLVSKRNRVTTYVWKCNTCEHKFELLSCVRKETSLRTNLLQCDTLSERKVS